MKDLNMFLEGHYWKKNDSSYGGSLDPDVSRHYWRMRRTIEDKWGQFKALYKTTVRQQLIDFLIECGDDTKWHTLFINPYPIEFDYNLKNEHTKGLVTGFYVDPADNVPVMCVDCLDGKPTFCLNIDNLMEGRMLRLRNNVLIDDSILYNLITKGYIAYTIPKDYSKQLRAAALERVNSDSGKIAESLKKLYKEHKYDEFEKLIVDLLNNKGKDSRNGKYIPLKRTGRFWNCYISQISIVKDTVWLNVYEQGDLSDNDEDIRLSELLKKGKMRLNYKNEVFTVDDESITDMIEDLEAYLKENSK